MYLSKTLPEHTHLNKQAKSTSYATSKRLVLLHCICNLGKKGTIYFLNIYDLICCLFKDCRELTGQFSRDSISPCSILLVMAKAIRWKKCMLPLLQARSTAGSKTPSTKIEQPFFMKKSQGNIPFLKLPSHWLSDSSLYSCYWNTSLDTTGPMVKLSKLIPLIYLNYIMYQ